MRIQFFGAAQTVTGSCFIIETGKTRFAIDCGLHQGNEEIENRNYDFSAYKPKEIDFIIVTHAHIDHTGLLPRMVRDGFNGPIFSTSATRDLLEIMLVDSAHIQETEAANKNKHAKRQGKPQHNMPLYTTTDAHMTTRLFSTVDYDVTFEPAPNIKVTYRDAGHILGSAFIRLEITEGDKTTSLVFSGDLGRPNQLIVRDPEILSPTDYLFVESTYGDRNHKDTLNSENEMAAAIRYAYDNGEKTIIPAFAVERTQQVIYTLFKLDQRKLLPRNIPIYIDSPMAIRATEVFRHHPEMYDTETVQLYKDGKDPLKLPNLRYSLDASQSKAINEIPGPAIVISASGMCNAGRIRHHLKHNLYKPGASIVFVGYQGVGTPGRRIVDGAKSIRLFGEDVAVKAKVFTIGGFSGHAGQSELLDWIDGAKNPALNIVLIHGEHKAQETFANIIQDRFHITPRIPGHMEVLEITPTGISVAQKPVAVNEQTPKGIQENLQSTEKLLSSLRKQFTALSALPLTEQIELKKRIDELNGDLQMLIDNTDHYLAQRAPNGTATSTDANKTTPVQTETNKPAAENSAKTTAMPAPAMSDMPKTTADTPDNSPKEAKITTFEPAAEPQPKKGLFARLFGKKD